MKLLKMTLQDMFVKNKHKLYMETQKHILSIAKNIGFILQGKIDMVTAQYQYQYMYLLYKPE